MAAEPTPLQQFFGVEQQPADAAPTPLQQLFAGPLVPGNIDLQHRPVVKNSDGSISTVRSITVTTDRGAVVLPTVSDDGRIMTNQQALDAYRQTGRHLGVFATEAAANAYAQRLHEQQAALYARPRRDMSKLGADIAAAGGERAVGKVAQPEGSLLGALQAAATNAFGVPLAGALETGRDFLDKHQVLAAVADPNRGRSDVPRGLTHELRAKAEQQRADYLEAHTGGLGAAAELGGELGVNVLPMLAGAPGALRALGVAGEAPTIGSAAIGALRGAGAGAGLGAAAGYAGSYGEADRLAAAVQGAKMGALMGAVGGAGKSPETPPGAPSSEAVAAATRGLGEEPPATPLRALAARFQEERAIQAERAAPWTRFLDSNGMTVDDFDRLAPGQQRALSADFINRKGEFLHALPEEPGAPGAGQADPAAVLGPGDAPRSGGDAAAPQPPQPPPVTEAGSAASAPEAPGGAVLGGGGAAAEPPLGQPAPELGVDDSGVAAASSPPAPPPPSEPLPGRPRASEPPPPGSWDPAQIAAERGLYGSAYEIRRQYVADADLAHQAADEVRQSVKTALPDAATREDATAYLQGTGNKRLGFNDTPDDVRARLDATGARPAVDRVISGLRPQLDHLREMVNDLGFQDVPYIKDYIHQMWEAPKDVEAPEGIAGRGGSGTASPVTKERSFKSIAQGMAMGYEPKTVDLAELASATHDVYRKTLALHSALDEVSKLPALPDGNPVVARGFKAPNDQYVDVTNTPALAQVARRMEAKAQPPTPDPATLGQYQLEQLHHAFDQGRLPGSDLGPPELPAGEEAPIGTGDRLYLHRQVWTNLRPILQHREPWAISRAYDAMSNLAKRAIFSFSLFHPLGSLTPNAVIGMGPGEGLSAALKGGFGIPGMAQTMDSFGWTRPGRAMIEAAVRDGVKIPPPEADIGAEATAGMLGKVAEGARRIPGVGGTLVKVPEAVNGLYRLNDEALWSVHGLRGKLAVFTHDQWKNRLIAYRDYLNGQPGGRPWAAGIEAKLLGPGKKAALRGMTDDQIGQKVGRWTSDLYGDQQWKLLENRLANDPKTMRVLSRLQVPEFAKELLDPSSELHQKAARRMLIAPDWFYSSVKAPARALSSDPVMATMGRHYLKNALGLYVGYNLLNRALSGHYMFQNPPGYRYAIDMGPSTEKDGSESATKRDYVNVGKQEMELPDWLLGVEKGPRPGRWPVIGAPLRKTNPVPAAVIGGLGGHYPSGYPSPVGMAEASASRSGEPLSADAWMGAFLKTMVQPYTPIPLQNLRSGGLKKALIPFPVSRGPVAEEAP